MRVLNERLIWWIENRQILLEYQAVFRKNFSTADNVYNLASIVDIKLAEEKELHAFFVDLKVAFDNNCRSLLINKLHEMWISCKFVKIIEGIYQRTKSAVLTGEDRSRVACYLPYSAHYT